jgi:hypothetical protein
VCQSFFRLLHFLKYMDKVVMSLVSFNRSKKPGFLY